MKKKLGLLNLFLAALFVWGCLVLHGQYERARQRYEIFNVPTEMTAPPALPAPVEPPAVRPAAYAAISQRLLLSQDRNPVIEVIVSEEQAERPQPPLLVGVVDLGDGPLALMAPDGETPPRWTGVGETVGEYTLEAFADDTLTLGWNGESIEMLQSELAPEQSEPPRRQAAGNAPANRKTAARTAPRARGSTSNLAASSETVEKGKYTIGKSLGAGTYAADPNDGAKEGDEYKGYVRRVRVTPFGSQQWWEKKEQ